MERERHKMLTGRSLQFVSGVLRLVRFFEETLRIRHRGKFDKGLRLLDEFLDAGGKSDSYHSPLT